MIVSALWLPARSGFVHDFEIDVANLEPVALTFRFRYVIVQAHGSGSAANAAVLDDGVQLLAALGFNPKPATWARSDRRYATSIDIAFGAGEVRAHGLRAAGTFPTAPDNRSLLAHPNGVLRGWWELSLPALPTLGVTRSLAAQLDRPARALVTVVMRGHPHDPAPERLLAIPTASGKAEHLIEPDPPRQSVATPVAKGKTRRRRAR